MAAAAVVIIPQHIRLHNRNAIMKLARFADYRGMGGYRNTFYEITLQWPNTSNSRQDTKKQNVMLTSLQSLYLTCSNMKTPTLAEVSTQYGNAPTGLVRNFQSVSAWVVNCHAKNNRLALFKSLLRHVGGTTSPL